MSRFHTRRDSKLRQLAELGPMVAASLCRRMVRCGNPKCRCAHGEKHESWCLSFKHEGKTQTVHVPRDMVQEVRQWAKEHRRAKKLMQQISYQSVQIIKNYVREKRAAERGKEKG